MIKNYVIARGIPMCVFEVQRSSLENWMDICLANLQALGRDENNAPLVNDYSQHSFDVQATFREQVTLSDTADRRKTSAFKFFVLHYMVENVLATDIDLAQMRQDIYVASYPLSCETLAQPFVSKHI